MHVPFVDVLCVKNVLPSALPNAFFVPTNDHVLCASVSFQRRPSVNHKQSPTPSMLVGLLLLLCHDNCVRLFPQPLVIAATHLLPPFAST
eukprot:m.164648 g.164648  ORF g.164648 m.164648 type:complete len:90 (-) comp14406_c0_seq1:36-305(-)